MIMRYAVIYERARNNYCAYAPDLPGCVSTGVNLDDVRRVMREAMEFHIEGMQMDGETIPMPNMTVLDALDYHDSIIVEDEIDDSDNGDDEPIAEMIEIEVDLSRKLGEAFA